MCAELAPREPFIGSIITMISLDVAWAEGSLLTLWCAGDDDDDRRNLRLPHESLVCHNFFDEPGTILARAKQLLPNGLATLFYVENTLRSPIFEQANHSTVSMLPNRKTTTSDTTYTYIMLIRQFMRVGI